MVVFAARDDEEQRVYLRSLDDFEMRPVQGSSDGVNPVFSPDGESIVFQARNGMFRAAVAGGPAVFLTNAKWMTADWSEDDTIVFSEGLNSPVVSMPAGGGERTPVTELAGDGAYAHVWPQRIGGTNKMLFTSWNSTVAGGARLFDMDTGQILPVESGGEDRFVTPARWSPSGHLIFESWGAGLLVAPFDPESGQALQRGAARPLLGEVAHMGNSTRSLFALSDKGTLVYAPGAQGRRGLVWVDAAGGVEPILEQDRLQGTAIGGNLSLSPDGSRVALGGGGDVVVVDLDRNIPRRLDDPGNDLNTVWGGAGRIFYGSNRSERWSVWSVDPDGGAEPELVLQRDDNTWPRAVASNGDLLISETRVGFGNDLMILNPDGEVRPLAATTANENSGSYSVDDRWVAFDSDVSGRFEVYVTRADGSGTPVQVTTDGGRAPKFGRSGETLYFRQHRRVMRVGFVDGRPVGEAVPVFQAPNLATGTSYEISPDETRMIAVQLDDDAIPSELRVITDFFDVIHQVAGTTPSAR
jgi:Tol biopolymer transport system component